MGQFLGHLGLSDGHFQNDRCFSWSSRKSPLGNGRSFFGHYGHFIGHFHFHDVKSHFCGHFHHYDFNPVNFGAKIFLRVQNMSSSLAFISSIRVRVIQPEHFFRIIFLEFFSLEYFFWIFIWIFRILFINFFRMLIVLTIIFLK